MVPHVDGTAGDEVPIRDFLVDAFQTSIAPGEMLTEIHVPAPGARSGGTYLKLERKVGDYATVAAAVYLELANGSIGKAGIGLTSVGLINIKATAAEVQKLEWAQKYGADTLMDLSTGGNLAECPLPVSSGRG